MQKRSLTADDMGILFLLMAIVFGVWFRLFPPLNASFPIGDGGLFYIMVKTLQQNHYHLPMYVQYNGLNIPFAYPPFGFYMAGWAANLFHTTILNTLLWIPAFVLIATIPAIYFLALQLLHAKIKAGLAAIFYALLPGSIKWLIMGGGITRSFGQLFLILATANFYLLFTKKQRQYLVYSILFSALVCLSHPEAAIHTITYALVLWLFHGRNRDGIRDALYAGIGTFTLTSPWWATVLIRFGLTPYLSASQTGLSQAVVILAPLTSFSQELLLPILSVVAILGIAASLAKRDYLLPVFFIIPFIVEARNATNVYIVPLAMLASMAFSDLLLPGLASMEGRLLGKRLTVPIQSTSEKFLLTYVLISLFLGAQLTGTQFSTNTLSPEVRSAFDWIANRTPQESKFVVITGETGQLNDFTSEWFPALTGRNNITTIQGREWLGGKSFAEQRTLIFNLQSCYPVAKITGCIDKIANRASLDYSYIMVTGIPRSHLVNKLSQEFDIDPAYKIDYDTPQVLILERPGSNNP